MRGFQGAVPPARGVCLFVFYVLPDRFASVSDGWSPPHEDVCCPEPGRRSQLGACEGYGRHFATRRLSPCVLARWGLRSSLFAVGISGPLCLENLCSCPAVCCLRTSVCPLPSGLSPSPVDCVCASLRLLARASGRQSTQAVPGLPGWRATVSRARIQLSGASQMPLGSAQGGFPGTTSPLDVLPVRRRERLHDPPFAP